MRLPQPYPEPIFEVRDEYDYIVLGKYQVSEMLPTHSRRFNTGKQSVSVLIARFWVLASAQASKAVFAI